MTSRTFFELQRVRAVIAAKTASETVRRRQFDRAASSVTVPTFDVYKQHRPDFMTTNGGDPIKRAYDRLGILYE